MPKGDDDKDGRIAEIGKAVHLFWKGEGLVIKVTIILAVVAVITLTIWKPWKRDQPTSQQTTTATGNKPAALNVSGTNLIHGPVVNGNGNNAPQITGANSTMLAPLNGSASQGATVATNAGYIYAPVYNNPVFYNAPLSNTVTSEAFRALEGKLANTAEKIELTRNDVQLLAQALRDLDQRTSDIKKLPDGRTTLGSFVSGKPKFVIEAFQSAVSNLNKNDFRAGFNASKQGVDAMESSITDVAVHIGDYSQEWKGEIYFVGALCAQMIMSNGIANDWATKAFKSNPTQEHKGLLVTTFANLANENSRDRDWKGAFESFSNSMYYLNDLGQGRTNTFRPDQIYGICGQAIATALMLNKTNEAEQWGRIIGK